MRPECYRAGKVIVRAMDYFVALHEFAILRANCGRGQCENLRTRVNYAAIDGARVLFQREDEKSTGFQGLRGGGERRVKLSEVTESVGRRELTEPGASAEALDET